MIQLQNIGKAYETRRGPRWVFRNVDLTIGRGEKIDIGAQWRWKIDPHPHDQRH